MSLKLPQSKMSVPIRVFAVGFALLACSCGKRETPESEVSGVFEINLPSIKTEGVTLIEALNDLNACLIRNHRKHPKLPIIIERHDHPVMDRGQQRLEISLPEGTLAEHLRWLSESTMTHWKWSENGFIIFKTWSRPQYDDDIDGGELFRGQPEGDDSPGDPSEIR